MFLGVRRRVTFVNVVVTFVFVFALSGGAFAANKFLVTSVKQIKPSVLKQLQGKVGARGAQGAVGPQGPQGSAGVQGAVGAQGVVGLKGDTGLQGEPGKNGENGKEGSPWTDHGTLPSEATETGTWAFNATNKGEAFVPVSFSIPLAEGVGQSQVHFVTRTEWEHGGAPAECPGSVEEPKATPGNFCVYESFLVNAEFVTINNPKGFGGEGVAPVGGWMTFKFENEEALRRGWGTWAVTAK
jgi:Collagen triple helix repeat (20 copies)